MIKVYKTFEIDDKLWQQIADGFNECFEGHNTTVESLKHGFSIKNQWGYAYHAVAFDDKTGDVMGFNTYTPNLYENQIKVFVAGSTFVKEKYRKDIFIFYDMIGALKEKGIEDGFHVGLGVPNHNSLDYSIKFLGANLVGFLNYYILPRNVSKCLHKSWLSPVSWLVRCMADLYVDLQIMLSKVWNSVESESKYSLVVDDAYLKTRFADPCYFKYQEKSFSAYFRISSEDGAKVAYLMDFRENGLRTTLAMAKAAHYIIKSSKPDAILFVGFLKLRQHILLKIPKKFVPKPLPLTFGAFTNSDIERFKDMKDVNNWNFSLMNFDVR